MERGREEARKHLEVVTEGMSMERSKEVLDRLKACIRTRGLNLCTSVYDLQWDEHFRSLRSMQGGQEANPPFNHKETVTLEHGKTKELNLGKMVQLAKDKQSTIEPRA